MPSTMTSTGLAALFSGEPWHYIGAAGEPAFASGWANAGGGTSKCAFRFREGGAVDIYVGATIGTGTSPFTVSEGYRPTADTFAAGFGYSFVGATDSLALVVTTAGVIDLTFPASSTVAVFVGTYWLNPPEVAA